MSAEAGQVPAAAAERQNAPFVDMMMSEALLTHTENNALTYAGSGNPLVDFFFQASPYAERSAVPTLFEVLCFCMQAIQCNVSPD